MTPQRLLSGTLGLTGVALFAVCGLALVLAGMAWPVLRGSEYRGWSLRQILSASQERGGPMTLDAFIPLVDRIGLWWKGALVGAALLALGLFIDML